MKTLNALIIATTLFVLSACATHKTTECSSCCSQDSKAVCEPVNIK